MANLAVIHDEHQVRLETKLIRELGDQVLSLLNDDRTEDILLNPDGVLRVKRMSEGFTRLCEVPVVGVEHPILETELVDEIGCGGPQ
jgi:Flp pilus assembly CpaF family ATPase